MSICSANQPLKRSFKIPFQSFQADLLKSWDYCRGYQSSGLSGVAIAFIILGSIAGVVILAVLLAYCI
jgi:hypothetical protein